LLAILGAFLLAILPASTAIAIPLVFKSLLMQAVLVQAHEDRMFGLVLTLWPRTQGKQTPCRLSPAEIANVNVA
jgi:hypothetical protein